MKFSTTITQKGQVTLPVRIRRSLGLKTGERVRIEIMGTTAVISKDTYWEELTALRRKLSSHVKAKGLSGLSAEEIKHRAETAKKAYYDDSRS